MLLDKRSYSIIELLVQNPNNRIADLEKEFQLTRRQINYSIKKINDWLESNYLPRIERSKNGSFSLDQKVIQYFTNLSSQQEESEQMEYVPTEKERTILLVFYLLTKKEELSLAHITDVLEVSKNTVVRDIKVANEWLNDYGLAIIYTRTEGYKIKGEELTIRKLLNSLLEKILQMYKGQYYLEKIGQLNAEVVLPIIEKIEEVLDIQYTDQSLVVLPWLLLVNKRRVNQGNILEKSWHESVVDFRDTREYEVINEHLIPFIKLLDHEREWLILQFLTANFQDSTKNVVEDKDLIIAIKEMIWLFEEKTYLTISNKQYLLERLAQHLRPAYYRVKYQITLKNDWYLDYIEREESYTVLFEIIKEIILPVEKLTNRIFNNNEIALLTFFFGAELLNQGISLENKIKAVVVCTNGISISRILNYSLKELFPDFIFLNVLSIREFKEYTRHFDIAFSTVPIETDRKTFLLNPLITEKEKQALQKQVYQYLGIDNNELSITRLLSVIKKHAKIYDEDQLVSSLKNMLNSNAATRDPVEFESSLPSLLNYLNEERIQFIEEVDDWKEGIRLACAPLIEEQKITPQYIETLINENDTEHTYSFLGETMAIPHADRPNQILNDGFSMLILKRPIQFKNKHKVQIIVPLAIGEKTNHLKAILQLQKLAEDTELMKELMSKQKPEEVIEIIKTKLLNIEIKV